jgi:hypothetical protein
MRVSQDCKETEPRGYVRGDRGTAICLQDLVHAGMGLADPNFAGPRDDEVADQVLGCLLRSHLSPAALVLLAVNRLTHSHPGKQFLLLKVHQFKCKSHPEAPSQKHLE